MYSDLSTLLAREHVCDLRVASRNHRLVAIATCCRPSTLRRAAETVRNRVGLRRTELCGCA